MLIRDLLDALGHEPRLLPHVAAELRADPRPSLLDDDRDGAEYGQFDDDLTVDDDAWSAVNADSRLTTTAYRALADAYVAGVEELVSEHAEDDIENDAEDGDDEDDELSLTAGYDPREPRDSEGRWTDLTPGGAVAEVLKKIRPTIAVYGKGLRHDDVIARDANHQHRIRWDEQRKKFTFEERSAGPAKDEWREISAHNKTETYGKIKDGNWYEPDQTSTKSGPLSSPEPTPDALPVDRPASAPTADPVPTPAGSKSSIVETATTPPSYEGPKFEVPEDIDPVKLEEWRTLQRRYLSGTKLELSELRRKDDLYYELLRSHPTVAQRLSQEIQVDRALDVWRTEHGIGPEITELELRRQLARQTREAFAGKKIAVRVTPGNLDKILDDGRFKSQFESSQSKGKKDQILRAQVEEAWFGIPQNEDATKRPIYGYVALDGVRPAGIGSADVFEPGTDALSQYGQIQVILRDDVRRRTTAMFGDSLNNRETGISSPVDQPNWRSFTPAWKSVVGSGLATPDRDVHGGEFRRRNYAEAQVHGGVTLADVEEVVLPSTPPVALRKKLDDAGVSWRVLNFKTAAGPDVTPTERARTLRIAEQDRDHLLAEIAEAEQNIEKYGAKGDQYTVGQERATLKRLRPALKRVEDALPTLRRVVEEEGGAQG